jgi:hypothetical protein
MSSDLRLSYRPRLEATPEAELEVLARVYRFLIQNQENRNAASGGCTDYEGGENNQSWASSGGWGPSTRGRREDGSDKPSKQRR